MRVFEEGGGKSVWEGSGSLTMDTSNGNPKREYWVIRRNAPYKS